MDGALPTGANGDGLARVEGIRVVDFSEAGCCGMLTGGKMHVRIRKVKNKRFVKCNSIRPKR